MAKSSETLQGKLHEMSDKKLEEEIREAMKGIKIIRVNGISAVGNGELLLKKGEYRSIREAHPDGGEDWITIQVDTNLIISKLTKYLFDECVENRRELAVNRFINDVSTFKDQLAELKEGAGG